MLESIILEGIVIGIGYALVAIGISITLHVLDIVNFSHGELYMLGGFFTFFIMQWLNLPYVFAGILAVILTSLAAWLILGSISKVISTDRMNTLLATFAISLMVSNAVNVMLQGKSGTIATPFVKPIIVGSMFIPGQRAVLLIVGLITIVTIWIWLRKSFMGKKIRAVAENSDGAQIIGIATNRIYRFVFIGGGAVAGLAGVLLSPITQVTADMGLSTLIKGFVVLVIGGTGNIFGAAIGGLSLGIIESLGAAYINSAWKDVFGYALLIIVLLIQPSTILYFVRRKLSGMRNSDKKAVKGGTI
ncbi:branched-chain amino acid ABC transporter permease [Neobacillus mesonae]|uniref:branched-chain amino acid ABC transporter permease n=1 Tax=Neobacillus mesonae TaxID=1193713 RepID=UPI00203E835F|nr:branched-chain amino acid ABC transporter permease [Neobacillus mesonae]MCM3568240.1 branched-chain amino acid ABC transporter permease [Neobacillus mesonae]